MQNLKETKSAEIDNANSDDHILVNNLTQNLLNFNLPELKTKEYKIIKWTKEEDAKLVNLIEKTKCKNWKNIASNFSNKTAVQCFYRWNKVLKPNSINDEWTTEEDNFIIHWVAKYGILNWTNCSKYLKKKTPKGCKNRWNSTLSKDYKDETIWNQNDELYLLLCVKNYKTSWSKIKKMFYNRTENDLKNKFYSILRRAAATKLTEVQGYENFNVFKLKPSHLTQFLQAAVEYATANLGDAVFNEINSRFLIEDRISILTKDNISESNLHSSSISNILESRSSFECNDYGKVCRTNMCSSCLFKLREEVKRRLASNKMNYYYLDKEIKQNNELFKDIDILDSTSEKISAIRGLIHNVSKQISNI